MRTGRVDTKELTRLNTSFGHGEAAQCVHAERESRDGRETEVENYRCLKPQAKLGKDHAKEIVYLDFVLGVILVSERVTGVLLGEHQSSVDQSHERTVECTDQDVCGHLRHPLTDTCGDCCLCLTTNLRVYLRQIGIKRRIFRGKVTQLAEKWQHSPGELVLRERPHPIDQRCRCG